MNDIDRLEREVQDMGYEVSNTQDELRRLKEDMDKAPYFLIGLKGCVRTHIAIFETLEDLNTFRKSCELKKRFIEYRKNSPLYGYDRQLIERTYIPNNIPFNPTLEDFKKGK